VFGVELFGVELFDEESPDDELLDEESFDDELDESVEPPFDEEPLSELLLGDEFESDVAPGGVVALEPRLSVLKNPEPLKVTPTG
jgi:hypothetical protein